MKKSIAQNVLVLIGILLYNALFWQEKMGMNTLIFCLFLQGGLIYLHPEHIKKETVIITGIGTLVTAILVMIHNSLLVKFIHLLSLASFVGFIQQRELRFIFYAFLLYVKSLIRAPLEALDRLNVLITGGTNWRRLQYRASIIIIPSLVLLVFYLIYYKANPKFAELSNEFWLQFFNFFQWDISFSRLFFFFSGLLLMGGVFWKNGAASLVKKQLHKAEQLVRKRIDRSGRIPRFSMISLKKEYQSGFISVVSLNVLLAFVNFLDIQHVWFGEQPSNPADWKVYVHEGTYLLIVAILLAMLVLLVLFRRNLNFLSNNKPLQVMSYVWIAQNAILALSVGIRNWRYVEHCGMAYKRIGVFIFLILVFYGLYTMYQKVSEKKSFYFLLHRNSWAMYAVLVLATFVNWDVAITKYNLTAKTANPIDVPFLTRTVSTKNLYLLLEYQDVLAEQGDKTSKEVKALLNGKIIRFNIEQEGLSFWSWNYADARNRRYLETIKKNKN